MHTNTGSGRCCSVSVRPCVCLCLRVSFRQRVAASALLFPHEAPRPSAEVQDGADSLRVIVLHVYYVPSLRMSYRSICHLLIRVSPQEKKKSFLICLPQLCTSVYQGWRLDQWNLNRPDLCKTQDPNLIWNYIFCFMHHTGEDKIFLLNNQSTSWDGSFTPKPDLKAITLQGTSGLVG